ncbi:hypothetical protein lbkm_1454 [Lachnospiraceae bacterium KM106-2]|nr:hypothetical protein lbkm_1454 [Lachnospiraceae bacterium KM106-2]
MLSTSPASCLASHTIHGYETFNNGTIPVLSSVIRSLFVLKGGN